MSDTWRAENRTRWDELTAIHLAPGGYDMAAISRPAPCGGWRWPGQPWLPLAFSLRAEKP